jgi:hypothetical protein
MCAPGARQREHPMRRRLEIGLVLLAVALHEFLTFGLGVHGLDIAPTGAVTIGYGCWRGRDAAVRAEWGVGALGLRACARDAALLTGCGAGICAAIGAARGSLAADWHLLVLCLLYPLWGIVQQFLVLSLLAANLSALGLSRGVVIAAATAGFTIVHAPNWPLAAASAVLGSVCTWLFLRHRNLWPLGVAHGVLAALFYRWVLGRDSFTELWQAR